MGNTYLEQYMNKDISYDELLGYIRENNPYNILGLTLEEFDLYQHLGEAVIPDIINARKSKIEILEKWKKFFKEEIAGSHRQNTLKLVHLSKFNLNPFLDNYKANFLMGSNSSKSLATALVYARALSTSINTTFGNKLQKFCSKILSGYASTTSGIDIEFIDFVDGRRKYCQIKAGPNTINKDDVKTIKDHFSGVKNLARTNNLNIGLNDLVVGVFYGASRDLSTHYKAIQKDYPIYIGQDFWHRLTGDKNFYYELTSAIDEAAEEYDGRKLLEEVIDQLADEIEKSRG